MEFLGTYSSTVVPKAAHNRIEQIKKIFEGNQQATYALAGFYVVVIAHIGDRWYLKFCTTSHKKGVDQTYERAKTILAKLQDFNPGLANDVESFFQRCAEI